LIIWNNPKNRNQTDFERWIKAYKKYAFAKLVVVKRWNDCISSDVIKFCQNVDFKSVFDRVFRKSPKFKAAVDKPTAMAGAAIKNDEKVPVAKSDDKIPLLDSVAESIWNLTDEVALLTDEVQAVKTTLTKDKKAAEKETVK